MVLLFDLLEKLRHMFQFGILHLLSPLSLLDLEAQLFVFGLGYLPVFEVPLITPKSCISWRDQRLLRILHALG